MGTYAALTGHSLQLALTQYRQATSEDKVAAVALARGIGRMGILGWLDDHNMSEEEAIKILAAAAFRTNDLLETPTSRDVLYRSRCWRLLQTLVVREPFERLNRNNYSLFYRTVEVRRSSSKSGLVGPQRRVTRHAQARRGVSGVIYYNLDNDGHGAVCVWALPSLEPRHARGRIVVATDRTDRWLS